MKDFRNLVLLSFIWVDVKILLALRTVLTWCDEWLSLSQKNIERGLIVCYVGSDLARAGRSQYGMTAAIDVIMAFFLWSMHRTPAQARKIRIFNPIFTVIRLSILAISVAWSIAAIHHSLKPEVFGLLRQWSYAIFLYCISLSENEGQRGRRRKLALDKVKALFGTSWIPVPAGGGA